MSQARQQTYRLGADIGGTFTDVVLVGPAGRYWTKKVPSTTADFSRGIVAGAVELLGELGVDRSNVEEILHGTTVGTNAILEGKGAKTALITTRGFRDVLEFRRLRAPVLYNMNYAPPRPLVERRLRLEVDERVGADGEVVVQLDDETVLAAIDRIRVEGAEAVAVCLLHSYRSPDHERRVGEIVQRELPGTFRSLSVDVLPEIREYERTSTTVINAYLGPIVKTYLGSLSDRLADAGVEAPVRIMQSNGGIMSAGRAAEKPVQMLESGPAAGVIAAQKLGQRMGVGDLITFDMGGTTAKAAMIEDGSPAFTTEYEVGSGISLSSRLVKGAGHAVKVPVIDLAEVGAGGGSIVWFDSGGGLKVGPRSAGAVPGPVCYDTGGTEPTVTDANLVLGYVNPDRLAGGTVELDPSLASSVIERKVAGPLDVGPLEAAFGVHMVANVSMIRALRAVSTYRGRDPRDFSLVAFGGSGPIHAANMARELSIGRVIVPSAPGVFSAIGLLNARPEHHFVQTFFADASAVDLDALNSASLDLRDRASASLRNEAHDTSELTWTRSVDLRYAGQAHELTVLADDGKVDGRSLAAIVDRFHEEHERTYGHKAPEEPVEIVNLRLTASVALSGWNDAPLFDSQESSIGERDAYFGPEFGLIKTPVVSRSALSEETQLGPIIVEEYDATTVVPPYCRVRLEETNNIVIEVIP